jgi:hypothetical protein
MGKVWMTEGERELSLDRCCGGMSRREVLTWALLGAGALALEPVVALAAEAPASRRGTGPSRAQVEGTLRDLVSRHAMATDNPWGMMHGIRAVGNRFSVAGGSAVEYLSSRELREKELAGQKYLYMPREVEGHANTFLKTLLEAGVGLDLPITAAGRRHTVADLVESAKKLFSFDPTLSPVDNSRDELAWSIIAFSITTKPGQDVWKNAEGQEIRFRDVVEAGFTTAESASADFVAAKKRGVMPAWKDRISNFTCGGTHLIYSLAVAVRYGHLGKRGRERLADQLSLLIWRLKADLVLLDQYYEKVARAYPTKTQGWRPYQIDSRLKFLGHAFEILSYARLQGLYSLTPGQEEQVQTARQTLAETILEVKQLSLTALKKANRKLYDLIIGDACHAYHGIHMVPGVNQV